jgi:hypothetical protein
LEGLEEVRYPWVSSLEFWGGGYWGEIGAIHLVLGWLFIIWICVRAIKMPRIGLEFRLAVLYFALTLFTNPAFNQGGLNINELLGVLALLTVFAKGRMKIGLGASPLSQGLLLVFGLGLIHVFLTWLIYPDLTPDLGIFVTKLAINFKILVLAGNLAIVGARLSRGIGLDLLIRTCLAAGTFGLLMYLVQIAVSFTGTWPYGTYIDAGFVGFPSFGSVSIERGHFGKFMTPYYPFFLFALLAWKARWRFALFFLITAINFSASSQIFFLCSLLITLFMFRRKLGITPYIGFVLVIILMIIYRDVFEGIIDKIYQIAIIGDESHGGGRSFGVFVQYLQTYPFGMGYSGSTLRIAPMLPEINAAHFAFVTQYSVLALPLVAGFLLLVYRAARAGLRFELVGRCMTVGVLMSVIIFFTDILWFVPMIWLSMEIVFSQRRRTVNTYSNKPVPGVLAASVH